MYPDVYFHSWQTDSSGAINRVLDGTVDLALTGQNTGDDSCVFIPFCQDNMVIATPVNDHYLNLKQKEQPVVFQDFIKDPVIIREKGSGTKKEMDIFLENAGIEPSSLNVVARMNDLESIKKSIVNGLGFSILSARSVVDLQKTKQILLFPLEESAHKRSFYIVYSKNRILKSHVRQFIHYVKEYYQTV
jgi:DNA-binding transcriptional LysR family regulator